MKKSNHFNLFRREPNIQELPETVYGPPPPERGMNVVLTNVKTGEQVSRWIYDEPLLAGRIAPFPMTEDLSISREHMLFTRSADDLLLQDCSRNGTCVNGVRILPGQTVQLRQNDHIHAGNTEYIISWAVV